MSAPVDEAPADGFEREPLRPLVPSERQRAIGEGTDVAVAGADGAGGTADGTTTDEAPPARKGAVRTWAASIDPRQVEGPRLPLVVIGLISLVSSWDDAALGVVLPDIRRDFGVNVEFLTAIAAAVGAIGLAVRLPVGYLADRVTRVWIVRIGSIVQNVGSIVQGLTRSVGGLAAGRVTAGIGTEATTPAGFSLMADWFGPESRARVFGFYYLLGQVGQIIGPIVAGVLAAQAGWRASVVALGVLATAVSALTFLLKEPVRGAVDRRAAGADEETAAHEQSPVGPGESFRIAWSVSTLRRIVLATPFISLKGIAGLQLMSLYFSEVFVVGSTGRGFITALYAVVGLIGLVVCAPLADRLLATHPGRFMTLSGAILGLQALGLVVMAVAPNLTVAIIASIPVSAVDIVLLPAFLALISQVVPARVRGFGMQIVAPAQLVGLLIGPAFVGAAVSGPGLQRGMASFAVPTLIAAVILGSGAAGVARDLRSAQAAELAGDDVRRARAAGRAPLLVCRGLEVDIGGVVILDGVDLDVDDGEIVALVGTNGAGKSTVLRAVAGVRPATAGAIAFDGRDVTRALPHEVATMGLVLVPGGRAVFPDLTVRENLAAVVRPSTDDADDADDAVDAVEAVLDRFPELRERLDQTAGSLSGGEQQMVALSQALLARPRLLLVDELSLGLAPAVVERLLGIIREIHAQGTTIVLVEQSLNVALTIAPRAVFLEKGRVQFDGPTAELLSRPDLVRAVFMGGDGSRSSGAGMAVARPRTSTAASGTPGAGEVSDAALAVTSLTVSFGGVDALRGVDLDVAPGEIVGIIGPNGAGKTTLFDAVSGFVTPSAGTVTVAGTDVTRLPPHARARLGLVRSFQRAQLFPSLTVRDAVLAAHERKAQTNPFLAAVWAPAVRRNEARLLRATDGLLELLGLDRYATTFVGQLSTGTRRIVDLACTLAAQPKVLLLDEPSGGLAQAETEGLRSLIPRIVRDTGCGVLLIEHDVPLVAAVSDRMVAMELGRVLVTGTPDEVRSDPRVIASYLSASAEVMARSGSPLADAVAAATGVAPAASDPSLEGEH